MAATVWFDSARLGAALRNLTGCGGGLAFASSLAPQPGSLYVVVLLGFVLFDASGWAAPRLASVQHVVVMIGWSLVSL